MRLELQMNFLFKHESPADLLKLSGSALMEHTLLRKLVTENVKVENPSQKEFPLLKVLLKTAFLSKLLAGVLTLLRGVPFPPAVTSLLP